jgi:hypothetical protein
MRYLILLLLPELTLASTAVDLHYLGESRSSITSAAVSSTAAPEEWPSYGRFTCSITLWEEAKKEQVKKQQDLNKIAILLVDAAHFEFQECAESLVIPYLKRLDPAIISAIENDARSKAISLVFSYLEGGKKPS